MQDFSRLLFENASGFPSLLDYLYPWQALLSLESIFLHFELGLHRSPIPALCHVENPELIYIGSDVVIEPFTTLKGPLFISDGVQVRSGAYIRSYTILGPYTVVGCGTEIKRSILLQGVKAAHKNTILDSIIGSDVNLGALATCANLRLDQKEVCIHMQGEKIASGMRKLGALIGNRSTIGCFALLNPGCILLKESQVLPHTACRGFSHA